jgi:hypothetical protein
MVLRSRKAFAILASAIIAAVGVTALFAIQTAVKVEEAWNITVVSEAVSLARIAFFAALAHALLLGIPFYLILRSRMRTGLLVCCAGGFLVGALPFGVLSLFSMGLLSSASSGGIPTVINGVPTLAGWIEYVQGVGWIGFSGLIGGLIFWITLNLTGLTTNDSKSTEVEHSTRPNFSLATVAIAFLSMMVIVLLPFVVKDNSCHNLFRDGRTSISPQIVADMNLSPDDWPRLKTLLSEFAALHSLSFRSDEQIRDGKILWRDVNLCNETGVNIDTLDQPWLSQVGSPIAGRGIAFHVYQLRSGSQWKFLTAGLLKQIGANWPGKMTFRASNGDAISEQKAMAGESQ